MTQLDRITLDTSLMVPIIGDGAIMGPVAGGTFIPVLIIDTSERPDLSEMLKLHRNYDDGDVRFHWGGTKGGSVGLHLDFIRPIATQAEFLFDPGKQGIIIDSALNARALYLREGRHGDNMQTTEKNNQVLLSLPHTGFEDVWGRIFVKAMTKRVKKMRSVSNRQARILAKEAIREQRRLTSLRISGRG